MNGIYRGDELPTQHGVSRLALAISLLIVVLLPLGIE
jgi:hypothetical protein